MEDILTIDITEDSFLFEENKTTKQGLANKGVEAYLSPENYS